MVEILADLTRIDINTSRKEEPSINTSGLYKCMVKNGSGQMQVYLSLNIEAESDLDSSNDNTTIEPQKETKPEVTQQDMSSEIQGIEQV